jgi:polysaccharide biosynthesis protein PslF
MHLSSVCHISTFSPTQCGIATYTEDLIHHLKGVGSLKVRIIYDNEEPQSGFDNTIVIGNINTYETAIESINNSGVDVVSLQHEFGIYGGDDGEYVVHLVERIKKPIVLTLHTVHGGMSSNRKQIIAKLTRKSNLVVVLTEESAEIASAQLHVLQTKIRIVRHGIPHVDFVLPEISKFRNKVNAPLVFVSAGHLRPTKGYEIALRALAKYHNNNPHFKYLILGTNQPQSKKGGNEYRIELRNLIKQLNLVDNVIWIDKYLDLHEFLQYILAADIGLVTYMRPYQSSSGILPIILGCGRLAVTTAFDYAKSAAKKVDGICMAEMNNPDSVFDKICEISQDRREMYSLMHANYQATRGWLWENVATRYEQIFNEASA